MIEKIFMKALLVILTAAGILAGLTILLCLGYYLNIAIKLAL